MPDKSDSSVKSRKGKNALSRKISKPKKQTTSKQELSNTDPEVKEGGGKKKKGSNEIDDLFKDLKSKRGDNSDEQSKKKPEKEPPQAIHGSKDDIFGTQDAEQRKRTEEGYAIYTEEELGFGKRGGDSDLCPFDCTCCF